MVNLKKIIKQLPEKDFKQIYDSLMESNAEKSAYVLKSLRERQLSDSKIMVELEINANAYYTLRSRLNQKIEEYLLQQMESPRSNILRNVAHLNEMVITKKRTIAIATLQKLEKELQDYDLSSELAVVYKSLKNLHVHSPEYYHYSRLYNRHVAWMMAADKAEDLLTDYMKGYGNYFFTGDSDEKNRLALIVREMQQVCKRYDSPRMYVYQSCMVVFHRLFVAPDDMAQEGEAIEDIFTNVQEIFETPTLDPLYDFLESVFDFLRFEYYHQYNIPRQAEKYYEAANHAMAWLLGHSNYTFSAQFFISKIEQHIRQGIAETLHTENENWLTDIEIETQDPAHVVYVCYRALCSYYAGRYDEATKIIHPMLNDINVKKYPLVQIQIKALLALQYCMLKEYESVTALIQSMQRQIRALGKDDCENVLLFLKILNIAISDAKHEKAKKMNAVILKFKTIKVNYFAPIAGIKMDNHFVETLATIEGTANE